MTFDELFENRTLAAAKLKSILRERGFSKLSFCKKAEISRPTLDRILNADIDNKSTFDKHFQKILAVLNLSANDLLLFDEHPKEMEAVYSANAPADYRLSEKAKKQYDLLNDILDLCFIYY